VRKHGKRPALFTRSCNWCAENAVAVEGPNFKTTFTPPAKLRFLQKIFKIQKFQKISKNFKINKSLFGGKFHKKFHCTLLTQR